MPDVTSIALSIKNLRAEFKQALFFTYENKTFHATAENILWLERVLVSREKQIQIFDAEGFPCHVNDAKTLLKEMRSVLAEATSKYLVANRELQTQITAAFTDIPPVPEHEE
jgi:hypothetical protein